MSVVAMAARPIDPERLLRFPIPVGRQVLKSRDAAFYALSIGMGYDPLDARRLVYVDPLQGPKVMPAMVLVMGNPGFWLSHPDSGVDPERVLHGDQSFDIVGEVPIAGPVEGHSRVTGLVDKGIGKAALISVQTELEAGGTIFAVLNRTVFIRGGRLWRRSWL